MELKYNTSKKGILLFVIILMQFENNNILGQSWSIEYVLDGDSLVYKISQEKIIQGKPFEFFFPAYKFNQTSSTSVIKSECIGNNEIIELDFDTKSFNFEMINFEIDMYAEGIDTIQYFLKTTDDSLILISQNKIKQGYKYLPSTYLTVNITNEEFKSIQIVGKVKDLKRKLILGRLNASKKIKFTTDSEKEIYTYTSNYLLEKQNDTFVELPDHYLKLNDFLFRFKLVLKDCWSSHDSILCISQFTDKLLNEYWLYDVYGINKQELINRNALLVKTTHDVDSYYRGMKEIIASLNNCHIRLSTGKSDEESPFQPIYLYNINGDITVSAIFDPTLESKIHLGDKLLSVNNIPTE